jgi:hypothetical protein
MIRTIKAIWNVLTNKDVNAEEPIKVRKRTAEEIAEYRAMMEAEKEAATDRKEPWVGMLTMDVDYNDLNNGNFELDWNDYFVARLMKAGYHGHEDADLVDQWFTNVCRNVVLETYEQGIADPRNRPIDLGDGRREYK